MIPRVAVVHSPFGAAGIREIVLSAKNHCQVNVYMRTTVAQRYPALVEAARRVVDLQVVDDATAAAVIARSGVDGVTTFHDDEVDLVDHIATQAGLPNEPTVSRPWDKARQRELFGAANLGSVRALEIDSPHDFRQAVAVLGLPVVLKPRRAASSLGLSFVRSRDDVMGELHRRTEWDRLLCETLIPPGLHPSGLATLADYVSVDTVSDAACHHHLAIVDKFPIAVAPTPGPVAVRETGILFPTRLPVDVQRDVLASATRALDALGVRNRVSHTEIKVSEHGIDVIEVNGRLGGDIARLFAMRGGPDLVRAAFDVALGRRANVLDEWTALEKVVACLYVPFTHREGTVRSIVAPSQIRSIPGVVAVDEVAATGQPLAASGFRTAKFTLSATSTRLLDHAVAGAFDRLATLFEPDGMHQDPWLSALRTSARRSTDAE